LENSTAVIKVNPNSDPGVVDLSQSVQRLQVFAEGLIIAKEEDVKLATDDLSIIARLKKTIEEKRKEYVSPINEHLKLVNDAFKAITAPLDAADKTTRTKVMVFRQEQQKKAAEIERINNLRVEAAQAEAKLNGTGEITQSVNIIDAPAAPPATVRTESGTLGTMKVKKWEVQDITKVPAEYLRVDEVAIGKLVRAGISSISGIRIWTEDTLKVNTK